MIILFVLGGLQGAIGWIMVSSGLVPEKYFVGHIELATHFIAALGLLCYTLWFALSLWIQPQQKVFNMGLQQLMTGIIVILFFQLVYGAFMAGLKAAISAPTWPDINGSIIPASMDELYPWSKNLVSNNITVHFIHRGLAYLLSVLVIIWWLKAKALKESLLFNRLRSSVIALTLLQVVLGIFTVLNATYTNRLIVLGVLHQCTAMLLLMSAVTILYILRKNTVA